MNKSIVAFLVLLMACFLCSGCTVAPLVLMQAQSPEMLDWARNFNANDSLDFVPSGLQYAGERLFVFGSFKVADITARSVILTSANQGRTWRETAPTIPGSEIMALSFPSDNVGFALVAWSTQGPGELFMLRSNDGGQSWEKLPEIPKNHYSGWPVAFSFEDKNKGTLVLQFIDDNPENLRSVLVTEDGAKTWTAFMGAPPNHQKLELSRAPFKVKDSSGTLYILKKNDNGDWELHRKNQGRSELIFTFPQKVQLSTVIKSDKEDCGCPSGKKKNRMLQ